MQLNMLRAVFSSLCFPGSMGFLRPLGKHRQRRGLRRRFPKVIRLPQLRIQRKPGGKLTNQIKGMMYTKEMWEHVLHGKWVRQYQDLFFTWQCSSRAGYRGHTWPAIPWSIHTCAWPPPGLPLPPNNNSFWLLPYLSSHLCLNAIFKDRGLI